ncbi:O-antigen polymerase [Cytobacillus firmus]|uniref:O-antigen polymerase n=1 Tax=Cytobacillus firmus TaxID=1399 RepID=UPI003B9EB84D
MKKKLLIKLKPSNFIVYGLVVYFIIYLLGPYNYTIYSIEGVFYYFVSFLLLFLGAFIVQKMSTEKQRSVKKEYEVIISKKSEILLQIISVVSIISFIIYFQEIIRLPTNNYNFASEDLRLELSASRSTLNKIAEMTMLTGPVSYLISSNVRKLNYKITTPLTLIAFFIPSFGFLSVGARGVAIISLFIFLINHLVLKMRLVTNSKFKKVLKRLMPLVAVFIVVYFIGNLFIGRPGLLKAEDLFLIYPGDTKLKVFYGFLNDNLLHQLDPLYKAFMYYTHSFPVFTYFYTEAPQSGIFYGALQFSFIFFVLNAVGLSSVDPNSVVLYNPTAGLYSTFISYFIIDYGKWLALFIIFFSGIVFGLIYNSARSGKIGYFIYPIILTMCFISPIYYFWTVGRMDVMLFWYFLFYPILKLLGLKVEVNKR